MFIEDVYAVFNVCKRVNIEQICEKCLYSVWVYAQTLILTIIYMSTNGKI